MSKAGRYGAVGLAALAVIGCLQLACVRPPTRLVGPSWVVELESDVPDDPPDNTLYFELVDSDAIELGLVEIAVHLHRIDRPLVGVRGALAYQPAEGGGRVVEFRGSEEGYFFERCRLDVDYRVTDRGPEDGVWFEVALQRTGLLGRVLRGGGCEAADGSGVLVVLRFALRDSGTVRLDQVPGSGGGAGETLAGSFIAVSNVIPADLHVRRR